MADDYTSEQFNSYNDASNRQIDHKSLYIKSIPVDLTEDTFLSLVTEGGKKIKEYRLFSPRPNFVLTCGLVNYHNEKDALEVKARLNGRPPLYLKVEYAHNNLENGKSELPDHRIFTSSERETSSVGHLAVQYQGRLVPDSLQALTVVVTGDKRIAFQNSESVNNPRECSYSPNLPDLIPSLCLFCNEKGKFSCGNCRQTYCSIICQRLDWPKHKPLCKSKSTISKQNKFTYDSSYMSEGSSSDGSSSDNDKMVKIDLSIKQVQDSLSKCQRQNVTSAEPRVCHTSSYKPCMPLNNSDKRIQKIGDDTKSESKEMSHNSDMENCEIKELSRSCNSSPKVKYLYSTSDNVHFPDGELDIIIYSVDESCSLFCAPFNPDAIKANLALTSEITQYCDNLENPSCDGGFSPELDELVLAKYDADNQWYRAVIVDNSHPFYGVIFIDYGNAETVSVNCIRKMEKVFMSLPVQTHLCSITGFTFDDNSLPSIIAELGSFVVFVNPKPLRAHVSSNAEAKFVNIPEITEHLLKKKLVAALKS